MGRFMVRFAIQYSLLYYTIIFIKVVKVSPRDFTLVEVFDFRFHIAH